MYWYTKLLFKIVTTLDNVYTHIAIFTRFTPMDNTNTLGCAHRRLNLAEMYIVTSYAQGWLGHRAIHHTSLPLSQPS